MTPKTRLLFVDDEDLIRNLFVKYMASERLIIDTASDGTEALEKIKKLSPDIVITDVQMPRMNGLELLKEVKIHFPDIFVVIVTGHGTIEDAVSAMKTGAYDYILKPFDFNSIKLLINKIIGHKSIIKNKYFQGKTRRKKYRFENIIGQSPGMYVVFQKVLDVAKTDATVLINGESGTGKELIAESIHYNSLRKSGPLVKMNCAALTETLINSEFFGHEKGAFTGALEQKKGHFELADGGTIFLDEIGDMPISSQLSLLRVLELGTFQRVGGTKSLKTDARFVCATNKDLSKAISEKLFREDLYYRINVVQIQLPPLRERKADIPLLADYYLKKHAQETNKNIKGFSRKAMELLINYDWPGNVRELANSIKNAVIFCKGGKINTANIPIMVKESVWKDDFTLKLSSNSLPLAEVALIKKVIEETNWNLKRAAAELEIARGTLYSKMKKYGLTKP